MLNLNISPWKLFRWFRILQLWGTGDWQLHHDNMPAHASRLVQSFWVKHNITQVTQPPYNPECPATSDFSQNKNHLWKGRDFRPSMRFRKIWWGSWWLLEEQCEVPKCLLWRGLRCHCPMYNVSCIFNLLQQMSPFFILHGGILSGQTSYILWNWYFVFLQ